MKISSSFDNKFKMKERQSFKKIPVNPKIMPEWIGNAGKWTGEYVGLTEQKLFLASSAFVFQPIIDMKYAEEDKKSDVAIKSASKAIAGGITGVTIRALSEKYFRKKIGFTEKGDRKQNLLNDFLFPPKVAKLRKTSKTTADIMIKKYASTLSNITALMIMILVTNEKLDVPITSDLQDFFTYIARDNKTWSEAFNEVRHSRTNKIKMALQNQFELLKRIKNKFIRIKGIINEKETKKNTGNSGVVK